MAKTNDQERLKRLESCVFQAQQALRALLPDEIREILTASRALTREQAYQWWDDAAAKLLLVAKPRPGEDMGDATGTERAYCPACGGGTSDPYLQGYSYPRGLEMHLLGEMSAHPCPVLKFYLDVELDEISDPKRVEFRKHMTEVLEPRS